LGARLEPCYALLFSHSIAGVGCANFEFAGVWAAGVNGNGIVNARRDVAPFWGVGATLGPRWRWGGSMSLEARGGLQRPLDPHRFRFSNRNDSLHEYPPLAFLAGASFAMAW
jgi:hypothetical protein